jgi:hypothetical protein
MILTEFHEVHFRLPLEFMQKKYKECKTIIFQISEMFTFH